MGPITSFAKVVGGTVAALGFFKMAAFAATTAANIFGVGLSILKIPLILTTGLIKGLTHGDQALTMAFRATPVGLLLEHSQRSSGLAFYCIKTGKRSKKHFLQ